MPWFAHSLEDRPESEWETQSEHSSHVRCGTEKRASKFGMGSLGAATGALHDLGKYKDEFLRYIRGLAKVGPDHSSAGAIYARDNFGWLGLLMAHAIAGHHAGLKDGLFSSGERLNKAAEVAAIVARAKADGFIFPNPINSLSFDRDPENLGFRYAFPIRMLFSCLVDADRIATETFYAGEPVDRAFHATPAMLADKLISYMEGEAAKREESGEAKTEVNQLRAKVLDHVIKQAKEPRHVFTLTVPTGGGKTLTSLRFALDHAREHNLDRVIVVIPFTSVIEQTAEVYREALKGYENQILEHHSAFEDFKAEESEERQEGRSKLQLATETWDAPLIVTTAVQFFESLFAAKTSRCRKLHNIANSVIVLDEAQTIPLHLLRPCVAALKELQRNYGASVVLCTATQPALTEDPADRGKRPEDWQSFAGGFVAPRELAGSDVPELFRALRRVEIRRADQPLDDAALAERMKASPQALCIVNSRGHARALFEKIEDKNRPGARHLSTLMLPMHRRRILAEIKEDLKAKRPCRVVSTSLVEAGVDFSFPLVLRAEAGLEQIAQAAGRCNRNGELEGTLGQVLVFQATGKKPLRGMEDNIQTGRMIMRHHADILVPDAIRAYFEMLYWTKGFEQLDTHGVLAGCAAKADTLNFDFETIANEMRLIDDIMAPVIIALDDESREAVRTLQFAENFGGALKVLQRHSVGIPPKARLKLVSERAAEVIHADRFGDRFVVLTNLDLYDDVVGLSWGEPTLMKNESLMV